MSNLKQKIHHAFVDFAESSTMHGFKDVKDASNVTLKVMWILAMLCSAAFLGYQTKFLLDEYWKQTTAINTEIIDDDKFQTVVYCTDDWIDLK